jgi:hypothetical protein
MNAAVLAPFPAPDHANINATASHSSCRRESHPYTLPPQRAPPGPLSAPVYLPFLSLVAPLTLAVPRRVLLRFFLCLPVARCQYPLPLSLRRAFPRRRRLLRGVGGLTLLPARLLDLLCLAVSHQPVVGLELLHGLGGVVDEGEAGALAATVLRPEAEDGDLVLAGLVQLAELAAELVLGDIGAVRVEDVTAAARALVYPSHSPLANPMVHVDAFSGRLGGAGGWCTHTTICLRPRSGLRMNLRVRKVTCPSDMIAAIVECRWWSSVSSERSPAGSRWNRRSVEDCVVSLRN